MGPPDGGLALTLGDTGQVGENAALPDGGLALGRCLGRLRGRQDKGSLAGALVKGGLVVAKAGKLLLGLASLATCMKQYGMKTRGIYLIPLLGAAAVAEDNFPSRRAEATTALAGPLTGAVLAAGTGLAYFATRDGAFAAAAAWMALINLFNLLPVVPLTVAGW